MWAGCKLRGRAGPPRPAYSERNSRQRLPGVIGLQHRKESRQSSAERPQHRKERQFLSCLSERSYSRYLSASLTMTTFSSRRSRAEPTIPSTCSIAARSAQIAPARAGWATSALWPTTSLRSPAWQTRRSTMSRQIIEGTTNCMTRPEVAGSDDLVGVDHHCRHPEAGVRRR